MKSFEADIDLLIKTCGKLAAKTNSLEKRVEELEGDKNATFSATDLSFLKDVVTKYAGEISQQKYQINQQLEKRIIDEEYHKELMVDIKEEENKTEEMFIKLSYQLSK